jgi:hypothetical protein
MLSAKGLVGLIPGKEEAVSVVQAVLRVDGFQKLGAVSPSGRVAVKPAFVQSIAWPEAIIPTANTGHLMVLVIDAVTPRRQGSTVLVRFAKSETLVCRCLLSFR